MICDAACLVCSGVAHATMIVIGEASDVLQNIMQLLC